MATLALEEIAAAGLKITASNDATVVLDGFHAVKMAGALLSRTGIDITILDPDFARYLTIQKIPKAQLELAFGANSRTSSPASVTLSPELADDLLGSTTTAGDKAPTQPEEEEQLK